MASNTSPDSLIHNLCSGGASSGCLFPLISAFSISISRRRRRRSWKEKLISNSVKRKEEKKRRRKKAGDGVRGFVRFVLFLVAGNTRSRVVSHDSCVLCVSIPSLIYEGAPTSASRHLLPIFSLSTFSHLRDFRAVKFRYSFSTDKNG